ncbi:MAG: VWA domain-containing protein [Planctomycetota bacterium]
MVVGPVQFDRPLWLLLAPVLWLLVWLIARQSLSGLGTSTRRAAMSIRLLVMTLLAAALAEPNWRREAEDLSVLVVVDASRSMPAALIEASREIVTEAGAVGRSTDRLGVVVTAEEALAKLIPTAGAALQEVLSKTLPAIDFDPGAREGTDLAEGVAMALAIKPEDSAARILLISDGNETEGNLLRAADRARSAGIPIDVVPVRRDIRREVIFEELVAPATARRGQEVDVYANLTATAPVSGRLTLLIDDVPYDLSPDEPGAGVQVELAAGENPLTIPVPLSRGGPRRFRAVFEPIDADDDTIRVNNEALAVTFVSSEGKVLFYANDANLAQPLVNALGRTLVDADVRSADLAGHRTKEDLQGYDAIVLFDVPASSFDRLQQEELASYVRDTGGGLVMVGGPNSFGAGGWLGTPVAEVLPVSMDVPEKRQMPRGALTLLMHSCEMPQGNFWGQKVAEAAVDSLSRLDLVGIYELDYMRGERYVYPLQAKGDGSGARTAIANLTFGDMQSFIPGMRTIYTTMNNARAGTKHVIVISDGDPTPPPNSLLRQFATAGITISTVCVFPHQGTVGDAARMRRIAQMTGGNAYLVNTTGQLANLPKIFVKEAQIVKRSLIWEGDPFQPRRTGAPSQPIRGMGSLPSLTGYIVTTEREGLAITSVKAPEPNPDPIVAHWQVGLGRAVAFTSDATSRWSSDWLGWGGFDTFWEQHLRWAMRPTGSANVGVVTQTRGDRTQVIVTALDERGESLNFARFRGRVIGPDLTSGELALAQTGPGRYEGSFDSSVPGSHLVSLRYDVPTEGGEIASGSVQAAVTRAFADEHRSLTDNSALLRQVADVTGGRVLDGGTGGSLFEREGLEMPVSMRPIWLVVALGAVGLFLADVAVRRVRIDIGGMVRSIRRAGHRTREASEAQLGALRTARQRTQERLAERSEERAVKFEASEDQIRRGGDVQLEQERPERVIQQPKKPEPPSGEEEEGMSRLLKAKRRARESMDDDGEKGT